MYDIELESLSGFQGTVENVYDRRSTILLYCNEVYSAVLRASSYAPTYARVLIGTVTSTYILHTVRVRSSSLESLHGAWCSSFEFARITTVAHRRVIHGSNSSTAIQITTACQLLTPSYPF